METLLVTGALGTVGRWTVDRLAAEYDVFAVDRERPDDPRGDVEYRAADLTDRGAAWELVAEADPDAVVHLAAIPRVGLRTGTETFTTNVAATYNVLVAAGEAGVPTVWTSSESAYGIVFAEEPPLPASLPIDESHPTEPEDPYGTSKVAGEEVAKMVARRYDVPVTSIRPSWVQEPGAYVTPDARAEIDHDDPERSGNCWSYVDVRDVVSLLRAAVDASLDGRRSGHAAYNAVAADSYLERPTAAVIEAAWGELPDRCAIEGTESAYSIAAAERDLGWTPEHSWRTAETESVPDPEL